MPIDNGTWHARVAILYSLKPLLKRKSKNKEILSFLLHHTTYFLFSILAYFVTTQLNYLQCVFNRIIQKIPISQSPHLLKIADLIMFLVFFFKIYSLSVGILRKILVPSIHLYDSPTGI